ETPILEPRDWNRDGVGTASPARNVERWRDLHGRGYFDKHPHYQDRLHRRGLDRVESMLRPTREDVFLDVGCGYGRMLYHVAPTVRLAIGLDVAAEPIQMAHAILADRMDNIRLHVTNGLDFRPVEEGSVTAAHCLNVLQHMTRDGVAGYFREFARVLAPGGRMLVQMLTGLYMDLEQPDDPFEHSLGYSEGQVRGLCRAAGLEIERLDRQEVEPAPAAWFWLLARRPV